MKSILAVFIVSMAMGACSDSSVSRTSKLAELVIEGPKLVKFEDDTGTGFGIAYPNAVRLKGQAKAQNIFIELTGCGTVDAANLARKIIGWDPSHPIAEIDDDIATNYHARDTGFFQSLGFPDVFKLPCMGSQQTIPSKANMFLEPIAGPDYKVYLATKEQDLTEAGAVFLSYPKSCVGLKTALNYNGRQSTLGLPNIPKRRPNPDELSGEIQLSCVVGDQPQDLNPTWKLYLGGELTGFKVLALRAGTTTLGIRSVDGVTPENIDPIQLAQRLKVKLERDPTFAVVNERRVALDFCLDPAAACNKVARDHKVLELKNNTVLEFTPKTHVTRESLTAFGEPSMVWAPSDTLTLAFETCGSGSFQDYFRLQLSAQKSTDTLSDPVQWMKNRQQLRDVGSQGKSLEVPCFQKAENICQIDINQDTLNFGRDKLFNLDQCPSNATIVEFLIKGQVKFHGKTPLVFNGTEFGGRMKRYRIRGEMDNKGELLSSLSQDPLCTSCQGDRALIEINNQVNLDIRNLSIAPGIPLTPGLNTIAVSAINSTVSFKNVQISGLDVDESGRGVTSPSNRLEANSAGLPESSTPTQLHFSEALRLDQSTAYIYDSKLTAEYHAVRSLNSRFTVDGAGEAKRGHLEIRPSDGNIAVPEPNRTFGTVYMLGSSYSVLGNSTLKGLTLFLLNGKTSLDSSGTFLAADDRTSVSSRVVNAKRATTTPLDRPALFYGTDMKAFSSVCAADRGVMGTQIIFDSPTLSMRGLDEGEFPTGTQLNSDANICSIL